MQIVEMRIALIIFIPILFLDSCRKMNKLSPPSIQEIESIEHPITNESMPLEKNRISGKVIHQDSLTTDLVAIKLTINDSICVNTYGDFDGFFSLRFDASKIDTNSYFEFIFREYSIKKILYINFLENGEIHLDKKANY